MILMPLIFDVITNENASYKCNECMCIGCLTNNDTIKDISVIHVTAHRCAGGLKTKLDL